MDGILGCFKKCSICKKDVVDEALVMVIEKRVPCYIMRRRYYGLYRRLEGAE